MKKARIEIFLNDLESDGLTDCDIASGLGNGDIEMPEWMAMAESTDHIKLIDVEDDHSTFQMGFRTLYY